jgi:hypothetical protein
MRAPLAFATSMAVGSAIAAEDPSAQDPNPVESTRAAAEVVVGIEAFSYRRAFGHDENVIGRGKLPHCQSGSSICDLYFDGETFTISSPKENFYVSTPFMGSFEVLVETVTERADAVLPVWPVMSRDMLERRVEGAEAAACSGVEHHLAFAAYDEDWQVWSSTEPDAPVPLMMTSTDSGLKSWPQSRVQFANRTVPVDPDPAQFEFAPHADDVLPAVPKLSPVAGLSAGGKMPARASEAQEPGSRAAKRVLRFLAVVSIIAGPEPLTTFLAPRN